MASSKTGANIQLEDSAASELELKKVSSKDRQKYGQVGNCDDTVEVEEELAISMEADDPRLTQEETKEEATDQTSNDDSDDIDADLDALE